MKWTIKSVTSNIMMVTGAITAITGAVKQIVELVGCNVKKEAMLLAHREYGYPPPPPPPFKKPGFEVEPFYGLIILVVGLGIYLIARRFREDN